MVLQLRPMAHVGSHLLFLEEVIDELAAHGIAEPFLLRTSELDKLGRVLEHGTDRAGHAPGREWTCPDTGKTYPHGEMIIATRPDDIRRGEREAEYSNSFKKFGLRGVPLLLIYDPAHFERLAHKFYRFRDPARMSDALLATIPVDLHGEIDGWFLQDEGLCYRQLVKHALRDVPAGKGTIVEVGCWQGRSTAWIARPCRRHGARLVAVDHYAGSSDGFDAAYRERMAGRDMATTFADTMQALGGEVELWETTSLAAAARFADESLDLVFLDGSHDGAAVAADLAAWLPKVRKGGTLAGHDYAPKHPDLVAAVDHFAVAQGLDLRRGNGRIWWVQR